MAITAVYVASIGNNRALRIAAIKSTPSRTTTEGTWHEGGCVLPVPGEGMYEIINVMNHRRNSQGSIRGMIDDLSGLPLFIRLNVSAISPTACG